MAPNLAKTRPAVAAAPTLDPSVQGATYEETQVHAVGGRRATTPAARGLAPVSVGRAVGVFLLAGLVVLAVLGMVLSLAQRRAATAEAIRDARTLTNLQAEDVVGPVLTDDALVPGAAQDRLDEVVRDNVLGALIVRVKIWDETGRIVYSDQTDLIGAAVPAAGRGAQRAAQR